MSLALAAIMLALALPNAASAEVLSCCGRCAASLGECNDLGWYYPIMCAHNYNDCVQTQCQGTCPAP